MEPVQASELAPTWSKFSISVWATPSWEATLARVTQLLYTHGVPFQIESDTDKSRAGYYIRVISMPNNTRIVGQIAECEGVHSIRKQI